jgi:hypothetical protein
MDNQTAIANMRAELLDEALEMGIDPSYLSDNFLTDEFVLKVYNDISNTPQDQFQADLITA